MKLADTRFGEWLVLGRIQSVCATPVLLSLGYATVEGNVLTRDILPLVLVGSMGHYAVFAYNDVIDLPYDVKAGKEDKPLVGGSIDRSDALLVIIILLALAFFISYITLGLIPTTLFVLAAGIGIEYNHQSKEKVYGPLLLGAWGAVVVVMGAAYGGGWNELVSVLAASVSMQLFWITVAGDLEDLGGDENSLPKMLGCSVSEISYEDGYSAPHLIVSSAMRQIGVTAIVVQMYLLVYLSFWDQGAHTVLTSMCAILAVERSMPIMNTSEYDTGKIKKQIVVQTAFSVSALVLAAGSILTLFETFVLLISSVGWNIVWQMIMYGTPSYYP